MYTRLSTSFLFCTCALSSEVESCSRDEKLILVVALVLRVMVATVVNLSAQCDRPCLNGGFCLSRNQCQCQPGYRGDACEKGMP